MRRRNVPCSPCSGGSSSGDCCGVKEKLKILWDRTIGSILRINGISPDGDGDFTIEAGDNIQLTERGTGNGIRIDTTGAVSYYSAGDAYVDVDNNDLEISLVNPGQTGGVALHDDLALVADAVSDILDGTTTVPNASNALTADALNVAGMDTTPTNGSNKAVTSDGIYDALHDKTPVNITSLTGTLFVGIGGAKSGMVQVYVLMNIPSETTNTNIVRLTSTTKIRPMANFSDIIYSFDQIGDVQNRHRNVNVLTENDNSVVINVGNDMSLPAGNWSLSITYITD